MFSSRHRVELVQCRKCGECGSKNKQITGANSQIVRKYSAKKNQKFQKTMVITGFTSGEDRIRTDDLLTASQAL